MREGLLTLLPFLNYLNTAIGLLVSCHFPRQSIALLGLHSFIHSFIRNEHLTILGVGVQLWGKNPLAHKGVNIYLVGEDKL